MSNWNVYEWDDINEEWDLAGTIPRSQEDIQDIYVSNQQEIQLADGSKAYYTPETYYNKSEVSLRWYMQDDTFKTQIEEYIINHTYLKIETHISGEDYIGRFKQVTGQWLIGESPDEYVVDALFTRME
jgi:hypothetical protein